MNQQQDQTGPTWAEVAPRVDEAMEELPQELRAALVLRYLEGLSQVEIATRLGVNQSTVSRRVEKGLERLRRTLKRAGVTVSGAILGTLLAENAAQAAPATLAAALGKMAMAGVGEGAGASAAAVGSGTSVSTSAAGTTLGTLHGKLAIAATVTILAAAGVAVQKTAKKADRKPPAKQAAAGPARTRQQPVAKPATAPRVTVNAERKEDPEPKQEVQPVRRPGPERDPQSLLRLAQRLGIEPGVYKSGGAPKALSIVLSVVPGSLAEKAGLRSDDEIAAVNGVPFDRILGRIEDAPVLWDRLQLDDGLLLTVLREGKRVDVVLPAEVLRGFFGPRVEPLGGDLFEVTFKYRPSEPAKSVYLAGTFNNWGPTAHKMDGPDRGGLFTTRLKLKRGTYEYKFVLVGKEWRTDPDNIYQVGFFQNSFLSVGIER